MWKCDASLQSAAEEYEADIICINETKTAPPRIQGYANWTHKQRPGKEGGGVAITTKEEISNKTTKVENIEDHDQEVIWIEIKTTHNNKIYIGTYYGKQEKEPRENIEREFSQLESQINKLQREAPIVLIGDFNAKIEINKRNAYQKQSPNGKYLQQLIDNQNLIPINTTSDKGAWTRVNRKNPKERSIIDYALISKSLANNITETTTDEVGTHRIWGRNETDHNTIMVNINMQMNKQSTTIKRWKLDNNEGWKQYNNNLQEKLTKMENPTYQTLQEKMIESMKETVGEVTIRKYTGKKQKENESIKETREEKKRLKKELALAIKNKVNKEDRSKKTEELLENYKKCQRKLREKIEENNRNQTRLRIEKLIQKGGKKSQNFWTMKKQLESQQEPDHMTRSQKKEQS